MIALFALVLHGIISHLPIPWEFRLTIWIISVLCCSYCCVSQNITGIQTRNRTITSSDDFDTYDLNMLGSVVERPYSSSSTHTRINNCAIPTISRPVLEDFSLQRQTSLHGPRLDFESREARLPISISFPFSGPSNFVGANTPSTPPLERPLS